MIYATTQEDLEKTTLYSLNRTILLSHSQIL